MIRRNKIVFAVFLFAMSTVLISARLINNDPKVAFVFPIKQNVLYQGVDNPVAVTIQGIPGKSIVLKSPNCMIIPANRPGYFNVQPQGGNNVTLFAAYVENGDTINAGTFEYRIKKVPDPVAYVNNIRNEGIILKNELQNIMGVFTRMENFDFDFSFKPQSFTMSVYHDSTWTDYKAVGPMCNAEMKAALHNAMPEDKIIFHEVVAMGSDSSIRKVNPVFITVK